MGYSISIYIVFLWIIIFIIHTGKQPTTDNRVLNLLDSYKKSVLFEWNMFMMIFGVFGIKFLLYGADNNQIVSHMKTLVIFIQTITLISVVLLFILAIIKLFFSIKEIKEQKPDKYVKLYYTAKIGRIFLDSIILCMLFILQLNI